MCRAHEMHGPTYPSSTLRSVTLRVISFAVMLGFGFTTAPASAAPRQADVQVAVVTPLSFVNYENLDFGKIIPANVAGTVTISTDNIRSATNGIVLVGTDFQVARFAGMGAQGRRVRIRVTPATLTLAGPGPAMTVSNFAIGFDSTLQQVGGSPNYRIQAANGVFIFTVGGRLNVGANQPPGTYSGTFTATLDYQ